MPKHAEIAPDSAEAVKTANTPPPAPIAAVGRKFGLSRLPDGSFRLDVTIPVELSACLESQADGAQEPLEAYIQRMVVEGLEAILGSNA